MPAEAGVDIGPMSLLCQPDIRSHYTKAWAEEKKRSDAGAPSLHGPRCEDLVVRPIYLEMLRDLRIAVGQGAGEVLDVGSGAGRWVRFFEEQVKPRTLTGVDVTAESVELLRSRHASTPTTRLEFGVADITGPFAGLGLAPERFDLVNIANVLFHIPEHDLFANALANLRRLVKPGGCVVTTEYLPRTDMRTPWMLVRSRYNFERLVSQAGLRIAMVRAFTVFSNDPMGIDGPDDGTRAVFNRVRQRLQVVADSLSDDASRAFFDELRADIDRAVLGFCKERMAEIEMPSQKLVALVPA
ncbi:MAG: class I SAM-dependent methyltransferase [Phycisphaerales bacterium]